MFLLWGSVAQTCCVLGQRRCVGALASADPAEKIISTSTSQKDRLFRPHNTDVRSWIKS